MTEVTTTEERAPSANEGYWGWKEGLKGSLSTLSLSGLGKSAKKQEEQADSTDQEQDPAEEEKPKVVSYWEWKETVKRTLSTVSLTTMGTQVKTEEVVEKPAAKNYWMWQNSFKSQNDLDKAEQPEGKTGGYWGWTEGLKGSLSSLSLSGLGKSSGKSADESPESPTKEGESFDVPTKTGPISNLDHKMRSSWRSSFQRLSSNSLSKLDEGAEPKATWKDTFRSFRDSVHNLNTHGNGSNTSLEAHLEVVPASLDEQVDNRFTRSDSLTSEDDGITF